MSTPKEMRICVYSDSDQTVLKRSLYPCDYKYFDIAGFGTGKVNIYKGESFIKKCGIAKRIIPFELKPKLFRYIDHINVIGGHYYHIAIKKCKYNCISSKQRRKCDERRLNIIKRSLWWRGKILTNRPYDKKNIKYIEFSYEVSYISLRYIFIALILSTIGVVLGVISIIRSCA